MINNNFEFFYKDINKSIENFGFYGNFSRVQREHLLNKIPEIFDFISKNELTEEQLNIVCELRLKIIKKLDCGFICNLFNRIFLKDKIDVNLLLNQEKKISKLEKVGINPRDFLNIIGETENAKKLDNLLFGDSHLLEKIRYFHHVPTFNDKGEMTFRVSQDYALKEVISNVPKKIKWKKLYQDWVKKGVFLDVKGDFKEGCYRSFAVENLTIKQFKELIIENGSLNEKIKVNYPPKYLTVEELINENLIDEDGDLVDLDIHYTADGFKKIPSDWNFLSPFDHTSQPPKDFTLDILIHTKGKDPVIVKDGNYGHASLMMTTPNGEIYSFGFYPSESIDILDSGIPLQKGFLEYVDYAIFLPSSSFTQQKLSYTLSDKNFHELMRWMATMKGDNENNESNLFYHMTHHNCTHFSKYVRDYALKLGAKAEYWEGHKTSNWTRVGFKIKYRIFICFTNFILQSPVGKLVKWGEGIEEYAGINNFNIRHLDSKEMLLPLDLIFEHVVIQSTATHR